MENKHDELENYIPQSIDIEHNFDILLENPVIDDINIKGNFILDIVEQITTDQKIIYKVLSTFLIHRDRKGSLQYQGIFFNYLIVIFMIERDILKEQVMLLMVVC